MTSLLLRPLSSVRLPKFDDNRSDFERNESEWERQERFWDRLRVEKRQQEADHCFVDEPRNVYRRHLLIEKDRAAAYARGWIAAAAEETTRRLAEDAENDPDGSGPLDLYVGEDHLWMQQIMPAWVTFDNIYEGMAQGNQEEGGRKELYQRRIFYLRAMRRMDEMFWKCLFSREQQRRKRELAYERRAAAIVKRSPAPKRESAGVVKAKGRRRSERIAAMKNES